MKPMLVTLTLLLLCACLTLEPPPGDIIPPTVVDFQPVGEQVPTGARIGVRFSEPVDENAADLVVLVTAETADDYFIKDLDSPPLSKTRAAMVTPGAARLSHSGDTLYLTPEELLRVGAEIT